MKKDLQVVYPINITKTNDKNEPYLVHIFSLNGETEGKSIIDAINMAKDYIGTVIMDKLDDKEKIPANNYKLKPAKRNQITTLVEVDASKYKRFHDDRAVKKTLTIPNYLNELGKKDNINFSEVLTNALKERLKL